VHRTITMITIITLPGPSDAAPAVAGRREASESGVAPGGVEADLPASGAATSALSCLPPCRKVPPMATS
jgi:hypothetical protein